MLGDFHDFKKHITTLYEKTQRQFQDEVLRTTNKVERTENKCNAIQNFVDMAKENYL